MNTSRVFSVTIDNLGSIAAAYSDGAAGHVLHHVWSRLSNHLGDTNWSVEPTAWGASLSFIGTNSETLLELDVEAVLAVVSCKPIDVCTGIVVSLGCTQNVAAEVPRETFPEAGQYRLDMKAAVLAYSALEKGMINFDEETIAGLDHETPALYHECLARLIDVDGSVVMPAAYIGALERLGLTRTFDRHVVREIIARLAGSPDAVLGCNISGLSASNDIWWTSTIRDLQAGPDIARRLVIEITESAAPRNRERAFGFISAIQQTGARVAFDDFGVGYGMMNLARNARADIVKIDASYVRNRLDYANGQDLLCHLVALATEFAPEVVVEGIETADDLKAASDTGAGWFQGYYFRQPATFSQ